MVSLPTRGTSRRFTASSATSRTVQRARPSGGIAANHGDDALPLVVLQQRRRSGPLLFIERTFETSFEVAMPDLPNRLWGKRNRRGNTRRAGTFAELGKC